MRRLKKQNNRMQTCTSATNNNKGTVAGLDIYEMYVPIFQKHPIKGLLELAGQLPSNITW